ncbi:MAG: hypothetical protein V1731_00215 [Candidatus Aenigmatarchaeota archaeon]
MPLNPVVDVSLETDLVDGGGAGGLGILKTDYFNEMKRRNFPYDLFFPIYPQKTRQVIDGARIRTDTVDVDNSYVKRNPVGESFEIGGKWYPAKITVYEHPLSTETTKAYAIEMSPTEKNRWLQKTRLYCEEDEGQQLFLRYAFANGVEKFLAREKIRPSAYHLNESDTALLAAKTNGAKVIWNTHTPLGHGHKGFSKHNCHNLIEDQSYLDFLEAGSVDGYYNWGLALAAKSDKIVCVSDLHGEVTRTKLYPRYKDKTVSVTNAIDPNWFSPHLQKLFDKHIKGWREEPILLDNAALPTGGLMEARELAKADLAVKFDEWYRNGEVVANFSKLEPGRKILAYEKRLTFYKRPQEFLVSSGNFPDAITIIAGKPTDQWGEAFLNGREENGKAVEEGLVREILSSKRPMAYILNLDRTKARYLTAASDVWVNIPRSEDEASGTSWMKPKQGVLVSTPAGSVPEVIADGRNGLIVADNLSNLNEKIEQALRIAGNKDELDDWNRRVIASSSHVLTPRMADDFISGLYN